MVLPLVICFFHCHPFLFFFWFRMRNINLTFKVWQFFCAGSLNVGFLKIWLSTLEKGCPFLILKIMIKKSYKVSQKLSLTALLVRYLKFLLLYQKTDGMPLFAYLILNVFLQTSYNFYLQVSFFWENILLLIQCFAKVNS